jgi:ketosteroid isomerase-like protein
MRTRMVLLMALVATLGLPSILSAQDTDPLSVVNAMHDALLIGHDIDEALSYLADDAVVTIVSPVEGMGGVYSGKEEVRGFWEAMVAANFSCVLSDCQVEGEIVSCINTYTDDGLRAAGVDFITGTWVATVRDGKVQSYTYTISEESLARFAQGPEALPETGGRALPSYTLVTAVGALVVAGGFGLQWLRRRSFLRR